MAELKTPAQAAVAEAAQRARRRAERLKWAWRATLLAGVAAMVGAGTSWADKIGPDERFSPTTGADGQPVRVIPIAPPGAAVPPAPAPVPVPSSAAPTPAPTRPVPPMPVESPESCASAGMTYNPATKACRETPAPAAPVPAPTPAPAPAPTMPAVPEALPTVPAPVGPPPVGYPNFCPWPMPTGWVCTTWGVKRVEEVPRGWRQPWRAEQ
jgi:hypothetical protein